MGHWQESAEDPLLVTAALGFAPPIARAHSYYAEARHIARWDPARVLAECEAKRRIVQGAQLYADAEYPDYRGGYSSAMDDVLGLLALPYADHPDYRQEWRP